MWTWKWSDQQEPWDLFQKSNQKQKHENGDVVMDMSLLICLRLVCSWLGRIGTSTMWIHLVFADLKSTKKPQFQGYIRTGLFNFSRGEKVWPVWADRWIMGCRSNNAQKCWSIARHFEWRNGEKIWSSLWLHICTTKTTIAMI